MKPIWIAAVACCFLVLASAEDKKDEEANKTAKAEKGTTDLKTEPTNRRSSFRPPLRNKPTPGSEHGLVDEYPISGHGSIPPQSDYGRPGYNAYSSGGYSPGSPPYSPPSSSGYGSSPYSPHGSPGYGGGPYSAPVSSPYGGAQYYPPSSGSYGGGPYGPPPPATGYASAPYAPQGPSGYAGSPPYSPPGSTYGAPQYSPPSGSYGGSPYSGGHSSSYGNAPLPPPSGSGYGGDAPYSPPPPPPPPPPASGYGPAPYSPSRPTSYGGSSYSPSSGSGGSSFTPSGGHRSSDYGNRGYVKIGDGYSKTPSAPDTYPKPAGRGNRKRDSSSGGYSRPFSSDKKPSTGVQSHQGSYSGYSQPAGPGYQKPASHRSPAKPYRPYSGYRPADQRDYAGYQNYKPKKSPYDQGDYKVRDDYSRAYGKPDASFKPASYPGYAKPLGPYDASYDKPPTSYGSGTYGKPPSGAAYDDPAAYNNGFTRRPTGYGDYTKPDDDSRSLVSPSPIVYGSPGYPADDAYRKNYGTITQRGYSKTFETYGTLGGRGYADNLHGLPRKGLYGDHGLYGSASYGRNYALNYDLEEAKNYDADQAIYGGYEHVY